MLSDGKQDANTVCQLKILEPVLLWISYGDIVACPDSLNVHVFRATVLLVSIQSSQTLLYMHVGWTYSSFSITTGASPSKAGLRKITLRFYALVSL